MANYTSSHTGAEIDSAVGRTKDTVVTAGTVAASSAVVVDANKDISGFRNVTLTGQLQAATINLTGDTTIGDGDTDNSAFTIEGNQLKIVEAPNFETNSSYSIRVQTKDSGGLTLEKEFTLNVSDVNEEPADVLMSASVLDENIAGGSAVATLSTSDPDSGDTHTYELVSGSGDVDNNAFSIDGNQLKIVESPDFESKSLYSVRVQTKDSGGLTFEKSFTLSVNNLEEDDIAGVTMYSDSSNIIFL